MDWIATEANASLISNRSAWSTAGPCDIAENASCSSREMFLNLA
jgi:hypothetical protein